MSARQQKDRPKTADNTTRLSLVPLCQTADSATFAFSHRANCILFYKLLLLLILPLLIRSTIIFILSLLRYRILHSIRIVVISAILFFLHCRGTSGIDIDLQKVDIDQCPIPPGSKEVNVFAGSDKCKHRTSKVSTHTLLKIYYVSE